MNQLCRFGFRTTALLERVVEVGRLKLDFHVFAFDMDRIFLRCIEWTPAALDGRNGFPLWVLNGTRKGRMVPLDGSLL
jgi:hypothetical protein